MSTKQNRGTKRTCQSSECGSRFYDLNRNPISCPICGTIYAIASAPAGSAAAAIDDKLARKPKKTEYVVVKAPEDAPEAEAEEALVDIEAAEDVAPEAEDETFLEEEEEGGNVTTIIGPVEGEEEV